MKNGADMLVKNDYSHQAVALIGAGAIGLSIAASLAKAGQKIVVCSSQIILCGDTRLRTH